MARLLLILASALVLASCASSLRRLRPDPTTPAERIVREVEHLHDVNLTPSVLMAFGIVGATIVLAWAVTRPGAVGVVSVIAVACCVILALLLSHIDKPDLPAESAPPQNAPDEQPEDLDPMQPEDACAPPPDAACDSPDGCGVPQSK